MMWKKSFRIVGAFLLVWSTCTFGQETTGRILGHVVDQTGAVLPGVSITATNEQTGLARAVLTNEAGDYLVPLLPVGVYSVKAELSGFRPYVRKEIKLDVNENERIDIELQVGSVDETITVTGDVIHVETTSSALSRMVSHQQIVDLPLNGRNFLQLGTLLPGVVPMTVGQQQGQGGLAANQGFSVNGMRSRDNRFLIDGATNNELHGSGSSLRPPPDALQEFNIITNSFSAEFGQSAGSIVNIITRSGTNNLQAGLWEFHRNDAFDARNFFAPGVPSLKQNQYGFTLGGPVYLPRIYDGHDKTHFFGYYEGFRNRQGITRGTTVPTGEQRQGNLSSIRTPIIDPTTGRPFPGNIIPQNRVNPVVRRYMDLYPLPNGPGNAFTSSPTLSEDKEQFGVRIDHSVSSKNNFYGRYLFFDGKFVTPFREPGTRVPGFPLRGSDRSQSLLLSDTQVFSPTLVNELRLSYLRSNFVQIFSLNRTTPTSMGFDFPHTSERAVGPPFITVAGFSAIGNTNEGPFNGVTNVYQLQENVSYTLLKHAVKFGLDFRRNLHTTILDSATNGVFNFTGNITGHSLADFLLGLPTSFNQGRSNDRYWDSWSYNWYAQDDFKVRPRLTLNLGLRWELNTPWSEERDRFSTFRLGQKSQRFPNAPVNLVFPGDPGIPRSAIETDKNNWAPRFGFAWDVLGTGRLSLRGGYGISYDWYYGNAQLQVIGNQPFTQTSLVLTPSSFSNPYLGRENPLLNPPGVFSLPIRNTYHNPGNGTPYAQLWNLTGQRELVGDFLLEVGYVGSKGTKLIRHHQQNPAVYIPGASTVGNTDQRRLRFAPNFASVSFVSTESSSAYHSLQATLNKRFTGGYGLRASYTWSKAIDFVSYFNIGGQTGESQQPIDPSNLKLDRGRATFDQRQRFVLSYLWELPFLKGRTGAASVLSGWQINGITTLSTGTAFTVNEPVDIALTGQPNRPDLVGNPNSGPKTVAQSFNVGAFRRLDRIRDAGRNGTAGRNVVTAPGLQNWDVAFIKNTRFGKDQQTNIQFRAEFFNIFNHPNFQIPDFDIASPNLGRLQNAADGRIIQFGLKLNF